MGVGPASPVSGCPGEERAAPHRARDDRGPPGHWAPAAPVHRAGRRAGGTGAAAGRAAALGRPGWAACLEGPGRGAGWAGGAAARAPAVPGTQTASLARARRRGGAARRIVQGKRSAGPRSSARRGGGSGAWTRAARRRPPWQSGQAAAPLSGAAAAAGKLLPGAEERRRTSWNDRPSRTRFQTRFGGCVVLGVALASAGLGFLIWSRRGWARPGRVPPAPARGWVHCGGRGRLLGGAGTWPGACPSWARRGMRSWTEGGPAGLLSLRAEASRNSGVVLGDKEQAGRPVQRLSGRRTAGGGGGCRRERW